MRGIVTQLVLQVMHDVSIGFPKSGALGVIFMCTSHGYICSACTIIHGCLWFAAVGGGPLGLILRMLSFGPRATVRGEYEPCRGYRCVRTKLHEVLVYVVTTCLSAFPCTLLERNTLNNWPGKPRTRGNELGRLSSGKPTRNPWSSRMRRTQKGCPAHFGAEIDTLTLHQYGVWCVRCKEDPNGLGS